MPEWITSTRPGSPPARIAYLYVLSEPSPRVDLQHRNVHSFRLCVACFVELRDGHVKNLQTRRFAEIDLVWEWLDKMCGRNRRLWIILHDAGQGLTALRFQDLLPYWYKIAWFVDKDPPVILELDSRDNHRLLFVDLKNYIPETLDKIGELIDVRVAEFPGYGSSDEEQWQWAEHCLRVIRLAFEQVRKFHTVHDIGRWQYTLSGMSLAVWRRRLGPMPIQKSRPREVQELERRCYYNVPVEVLYYGKYNKPCHLIDVNSMFPYVMRDSPVPRELHATGRGMRDYLDRFKVVLSHTCAVALVESHEQPYPIKLADGTYFATGRFWTTLPGPELERAARDGHLIDMDDWAVYRTAVMFADYVDYWHPLKTSARKQGRTLDEFIAKQMLVSLHGKLGQRKDHWMETPAMPDDPKWGRWREWCPAVGDVTDYRSIAGTVEYSTGSEEARYAFAAIPAWVTAYARQYMDYICSVAGPRNVLYRVADGAIVTQEGYRNVMSGEFPPADKPGGIVSKAYDTQCEVVAPGRYSVGHITRHAGFVDKAAMRDRVNIVEGVRQRLSDVMTTGPVVGLIHYARVRQYLVGNHRMLYEKGGWSKPPVVYADGEDAKKRARGTLPQKRYDEL